MSESLRNILKSLRESQKRRSAKSNMRLLKSLSKLRISTKKSRALSTSKSASKSASKKNDGETKFGCSFRRSTKRCISVPGSDYVDSACRRVKKHGENACRLTRKARSYKRHMSARSIALLRDM